MKKLKHYLTASIGLILFVSVIALSLPQTGHSSVASDKDVRVINTPAEPVPVVAQGTTNVAVQNTPTVKAQQNGAWNVGITGTPTVQLDDSATNPVLVRDVDRPTAQPFQHYVEVTLGEGGGGENAPIPIPAGKLLVIEHVSAFGMAPAEQNITTFSIGTHVYPDNAARPHYLQSTKEDVGSNTNQYIVSQQVRLYADAPSAYVRITRAQATGTATVRFTVSGYLVNK